MADKYIGFVDGDGNQVAGSGAGTNTDPLNYDIGAKCQNSARKTVELAINGQILELDVELECKYQLLYKPGDGVISFDQTASTGDTAITRDINLTVEGCMTKNVLAHGAYSYQMFSTNGIAANIGILMDADFGGGMVAINHDGSTKIAVEGSSGMTHEESADLTFCRAFAPGNWTIPTQFRVDGVQLDNGAEFESRMAKSGLTTQYSWLRCC